MKTSKRQLPVLSKTEEKAEKPFLDRLNKAVLAYQQGMLRCATVLLSITAPLCATRPLSGISATLSAFAILSAAVSLLAGLRMLRAPARQRQEATKTVLAEVEAARREQRPIHNLQVSTAWNWLERLASHVQPAALIASIVLLALSAVLP